MVDVNRIVIFDTMNIMFTAVCPHCSHSYKLDDSLAGKRATCKECRNVFVIEESRESNGAAVQTDHSESSFDLRTPPTSEKKTSNVPKVETFSAGSGLWKVGDVILGVYEVKPIAEGVPHAEGGVGVVHRIYHREWDMDLAVKSPKPQFFQTEHGKKSYEQEAQTWVELGLHPNIVTCYLVRRLGGIPRLFAEFVPDGSLRDWIFDGRLYQGSKDETLLRILDIAIQFAWGLDHAHRQTLLHLDVKPANVMMSGLSAKVSDFGLSQTVRGGSGDEESENYVTIGMTPGYCSPEQFSTVELMKQQQFDNLPKMSVQTDMWSWAVSVFGMFLGGPPCNKQGGHNARTVFQDFLNRPHSKKIPAVPEAVAKLLMQCFEIDPMNRPKSMELVADELTKIYTGIAGTAFPRPKPINATWTPESINNRAVSLLDLNKPDEAMKLFNQAIAMQPWHPDVTYNRTILSWRLAQLTDLAAIEQLETLIKMRPNETRAVYALGAAQRERGNLSAALNIFNDALAVEDKEYVHRAVAAVEPILADEARCLGDYTLADLPRRQIFADSKGGFMLFMGEPQTLCLYSTINGQLRRKFKVPDTAPSGGDAPGGGKKFALSSDLLWELYAETEGFVMRRVGTPKMAYTFRQINLGRRTAEKTSNQVVLLDKALLGTIVQNRVEIVDIKTKRQIGSLLGHEDNVTALAFHTGGKFAFTAGDDRTVRLWQIPSCRCLRTFTVPKQTIDAVYIDPGGLFALSLTAGGSLRLWATAILCRPKAFHAPLQLSNVTSAEEAGRQQSEMERLCGAIRQSVQKKDYAAALEWYAKAKKHTGWEAARHVLELEGVGGIIRRRTVRNTFDSALCTHTLSGHQNAVTSIAISADANLIASAGEDGEIRVWNIAEQKCIADIQGHNDEVRSVVMTSDAKYLISGSRDGSVRIWHIGTGKPLRSFGEHVMMLTNISLNPRERTIAIADAAGTIRLWDVLDNSITHRYSCRNDGVNAVKFSRDGQYLAAGGNDGSVKMWKTGNDEPVYAFHDHSSPVTAVALSVDMNRLFSSDRGGRIVVRNLQTNRQEYAFQGHVSEISGLELLASAGFLFSASRDGDVKIWNLTKEPVESVLIEGHTAAVTSMRLEISGRRLVTGGADGVVRIWELQWQYQFPGWQPMPASARSVMRSLMSLYSDDKGTAPKIDEAASNRILLEMDYCGFGTIPSETLKQTLNELLEELRVV